ncbi:phosphoribosyltransferase family protein [Spongiactinospora sp. TRM90649]|uniref:phosphoribosyltransferase n=1 Tax=Spongiactinospora sp. TRM90649 TaxID=3031114 RepID=UPI0023F7E84A|nr:phosphoribosyltransferase family protein [Spongiactinospora sp. TRM90649]MDF5757870.1 phosphoribosyltransferase family protein [Spongiactinospora sp. TRM90649]
MGGERIRLPFIDRWEAGRILAERLTGLGLSEPVVLALPRGGLPVGAPVAERLGGVLDVLVTRKIGYPPQPELGVGAIAEGGEPVFDEELMGRLGLSRAALAPVIASERAELRRRVAVYRGDRPLPELRGRDVVVVDDGLATGNTARAGLAAVRAAGPARLVLAVPVGAPETVESMWPAADDVVVPVTPASFQAVGQWYARFGQLTDEDVLEILGRYTPNA